MNDQEKDAKNQVLAVLGQVDQMPAEEQDEFWAGLAPEMSEVVKSIDAERKMIAAIGQSFANVSTESGEPITKIAFGTDTDDEEDTYTIDLVTGRFE